MDPDTAKHKAVLGASTEFEQSVRKTVELARRGDVAEATTNHEDVDADSEALGAAATAHAEVKGRLVILVAVAAFVLSTVAAVFISRRIVRAIADILSTLQALRDQCVVGLQQVCGRSPPAT